MQTTEAAALGQEHRIVREGLATLNPSQAAHVLREMGYDRNRRVSAEHVKVLAEMMRRGSWLPKDALTFARLPAGQLVLVNGHHRMAAQVESATNILWSIVIHDCADADEVAALYYRFDTNVRRRSDENILAAVDFAAGSNISADWRRSIWRAAPILAAGLVSGRQSRGTVAAKLIDDRLQIANTFLNEGVILCRSMREMPVYLRRKMGSGPLTATALVILRADPAMGEIFLTSLAKNDRLPRDDARSAFLSWLAALNLRTVPEASGPVALAKTWNAFRGGRSMRIIRVAPGQVVRIEGTSIEVSA